MKRFLSLIILFAIVFSMQSFCAFADTASADNTPQNIFTFENDEVPEVYFTNLSSPVYMLLPDTNPAHAEIVKALSETKAIKLSKFDPNSGIDTGFFVISKSGKIIVNLRPGNIIEIDGMPFGTTTRQYNRLVGLGNDDYDDLKPIVQWCAFMNHLNITKIEYSALPGAEPREIPAGNVRIAAKELHELKAQSGKRIFPDSLNLENWANRIKVVYTFENETQYTVYANASFLFIESKGMTYSCQYSGDYSAYVTRMKEFAAGPVKPAAPVTPPETKNTITK